MKGESETRTKWSRRFLYLRRFNTVAIFLLVLLALGFTVWGIWRDRQMRSEYEGAEFGEARPGDPPYSGELLETSAGEFVAYYEADDVYGQAEESGLTIVDPATARTLEIGTGADEHVIHLEFLYERTDDKRIAIGYVAGIADPQQYERGRMDLVVGGLPELTQNVVARDVVAADLPRVRGDGTMGIILWQEDTDAELVGFRIADGEVIDRARINLPVLRENVIGPEAPTADVHGKAEAPMMRPGAGF